MKEELEEISQMTAEELAQYKAECLEALAKGLSFKDSKEINFILSAINDREKDLKLINVLDVIEQTTTPAGRFALLAGGFAVLVDKELADICEGKQKTQKDYTRLAAEAAKICENTGFDGVALFDKCLELLRNNPHTTAADAFLSRLSRNMCLSTNNPLLFDYADNARVATEFWTDAEILQNLNLADKDARHLLLCLRELWLNDKQTGFFQLPARYRDAASQGNYGALIDRLLKKPIEVQEAAQKVSKKQCGKYHITPEGKSMLSEYFTPEFREGRGINWYNRFVDDLELIINTPRSKKQFASVLLIAFNSRHVTEKVKGMAFKEWLELWQVAFRIEKLQYKESQLNPKWYEKQYSYLS